MQPEASLSRRIMKAWRARGAWCFKVHGSEFQPDGIPDICGIYRGQSVWCETKMPGNKPSRKQRYRINKIRQAGGLVVIGYSVAEASELLDHVEEGHKALCGCSYSELYDIGLKQ